jgi:hypothetical protein
MSRYITLFESYRAEHTDVVGFSCFHTINEKTRIKLVFNHKFASNLASRKQKTVVCRWNLVRRLAARRTVALSPGTRLTSLAAYFSYALEIVHVAPGHRISYCIVRINSLMLNNTCELKGLSSEIGLAESDIIRNTSIKGRGAGICN